MARREPEKYSLDPEEVKEARVPSSWTCGRRGRGSEFLGLREEGAVHAFS